MTGRFQTRLRASFAGILTLAALGLVVLFALRADGREATDASSHDGGAWLVDKKGGQVRHIEHGTREITAFLLLRETTSQDAVVVRQSGATIVAHNRTQGSISFLSGDRAVADPESVLVPTDAVVWATANGVAVHQGSSRIAWLTSPGEAKSVGVLANTEPKGEPFQVSAALLTVSVAGQPIYVSGDGQLRRGLGDAGTALPDDVVISDAREPDGPKLTAVGDAAVLVENGRWLIAQSSGVQELTVDLVARRVQQPGYASQEVALIDENNNLTLLDLGTGTSRTLRSVGEFGEVTDLIWHRGCAYMLTELEGQVSSLLHCDGLERYPAESLGATTAELRLVNGWVWIDDRNAADRVFEGDQLFEVDDIAEPTPAATTTAVPSVTPEPEVGAVDEADVTAACTDTDPLVAAAPVASDDIAPGTEAEDGSRIAPTRFATRLGRPLVADVLRNDFDADCDALFIESAELVGGTGGAVAVSPDGQSVVVTPPGQPQVLTFEYTISDGAGSQATARAEVDVYAQIIEGNRPPAPRLDRLIGSGGSVVRVNVLANDVDPDGDSIQLLDVSSEDIFEATGVRILSSHPAGDVLISLPNLDQENDVVEIPYTVVDQYGDSGEGTIEVLVRLSINQPPDARNDALVATVGQRVSLNLIENDVDNDNDPIRIASNVQPVNYVSPAGVADPRVIPRTYDTTASGELVFEADVAGTYLLEYSVTDAEADSARERSPDRAQVRVEVTDSAENRAPIALPDSTVLQEGESRIVRALDNDGDQDGDVIGITSFESNNNLNIRVIEDVGFIVKFASTEGRVETFRYRVSDGQTESQDTVVVVSRSDSNFVDGPPVAVDDVIRVRPGRSSIITPLPNDYDPEGHKVQLADPPGTRLEVQGTDIDGITVVVADDQRYVTITVPSERRLPFRFAYTIVDDVNPSLLASGLVDVSLVSEDQDTRPLARTDRVVVREGKSIEIPVLANDTDYESDALRLTGAVPDAASGGIVVLNEAGDGFVYRPRPGFVGTDRFSYRVTANGAESDGLVEIGVLPESRTNNPPIAVDDLEFEFVAGSGTQFLDVLANDIDLDGDPLSVIEVAGDLRAEVIADGTGVNLELATESAIDDDDETIALTYVIADGRGGTADARIIINVVPGLENVAPIADPDIAGPFTAGTTHDLDVLINDRDPDASVEFDEDDRRVDLRLASLSSEFAEVVLIEAPHPTDPDRIVLAEQLRVTLPATESNEGSSLEVRYRVTDAQGATADSFVTIAIEPNLPPVVQDPIVLPPPAQVAYPNDAVPDIDLANYVTDSDVNEQLEFFLPDDGVRTSGGFARLVEPDGSVVRLVADETATEAFIPFVVRDSGGNEVAGVVTIRLQGPPNRPPIATNIAIDLEAGVSQPLDLASLFDDPDGDELTFDVSPAPPEPLLPLGSATDGSLTLAADVAADEAQAEVSVTASDGELEATATVLVNVTLSTIEPPIAQPDNVRLLVNPPVTNVEVRVLDNDISLLDDGTLTIADARSDAAEGSVQILNSVPATLLFTPTDGYSGTATVQYDVQDAREERGQSTGILTIDVVGLPSPPQGVEATATGAKSANLSWIAPEANGSPVDDYEVQVFEEGVAVGGPESTGALSPQRSFADLASGETYTFQVRAHNEAGWGEWSVLSNGVTPDEVPAAPSPPTVEFVKDRSGVLAVAWNTPANGGSQISRFEVEGDCPSSNPTATIAADLGGNNEVLPAYATEFSNLVDGELCSFRVHAVNKAVERPEGIAQWSGWSLSECPVGALQSPATPTAFRGDGQARVEWTAPTNPDCQPIERYEITRTGTDNTTDVVEVSGGVFESTAAQLQNGVGYQFSVRALNRQGWSPPSNLSASVIPCGIPGQPGAPLVFEGDQQIRVERTTEAPANGCEISEYIIIWEPGSQQTFGDGVVSGLNNGTVYKFQVQARNEEGLGPVSVWSESVTPVGPPFPGDLTILESGQDANGVPTLVWKADYTGKGNGSLVMTTTIQSSAQSTSASGETGQATCLNEQGNQCLGDASSAAIVATESCAQQIQTVSARATGDNGRGVTSAVPDPLTVDLDGCPEATNSLSYSTRVIDGQYDLQWAAPGAASSIYLQFNGESPGQWQGPFTNSGTSLPLPSSNNPSVAVWSCNSYGCTRGNSVTIEVEPEPVELNATVRCFEDHAEVVGSGTNAQDVYYVYGFFPNESVEATWDPEWPGDVGFSSLSANSEGRRLVRWECADDENNDPGQQNSPRTEAITLFGVESQRSITVYVNQLPPS